MEKMFHHISGDHMPGPAKSDPIIQPKMWTESDQGSPKAGLGGLQRKAWTREAMSAPDGEFRGNLAVGSGDCITYKICQE